MIKDFDWLYENKIKALLKLDRFEKAMECYEKAPLNVEMIDLLIDAEKYSLALDYCLEDGFYDFEEVIDQIKEKNTTEIGEYYLSWIYKIKSKSDTEVCPQCGGKLIPIVWGFPSDELLRCQSAMRCFWEDAAFLQMLQTTIAKAVKANFTWDIWGLI